MSKQLSTDERIAQLEAKVAALEQFAQVTARFAFVEKVSRQAVYKQLSRTTQLFGDRSVFSINLAARLRKSLYKLLG